jgi:hypothetical protein
MAIIKTKTKAATKLSPSEIQRNDAEKRREDGLKTLMAKPEAQEMKALAHHAPLPVAEPTGNPVQDYLNQYANATIPGLMFRFNGKDGEYVKLDGTALELKEDDVFVFLSDQIWCGWISFDQSDEHNPPRRVQGLLSDGFKVPPRDSLGDTDENLWPVGLSGRAEDPWKMQLVPLLQNCASGELFAFLATNPTSRGACHDIMSHCQRRERTGRDDYPLVKLKKSGYLRTSPPKVWVHKPVFTVVGHQPKSEIIGKTDASLRDDMNDSLPEGL